MKKTVVLIICINLAFAFTCKGLLSKYDAPNPEQKTMKQLKRWYKKHVNKIPEYLQDDVLECLIDNAADNPNKETIAGE
jgi:hypothetical protein